MGVSEEDLIVEGVLSSARTVYEADLLEHREDARSVNPSLLSVRMVFRAERQLSSLPDLVRSWASFLVRCKVKVGPPKVLLLRGGYSNDVLSIDGGLYVIANVKLVTPDRVSVVKKLGDVRGTAPLLGIPYESLPLVLEDRLMSALDDGTRDAVGRHVRRIDEAVSAAVADMRLRAPDLARLHREKNDGRDASLLVDRLAPVLAGSDLCDLSPDTLKTILSIDHSDLDKVVGFIRRFKVMAREASVSSCEKALSAAKVIEVMDE